MKNTRIKKLLLAGTACLALFSVLLAARTGVLELPGSNGGTRISQSAATLPERDTWMNIFQNGTKIGYAHATLAAEGHYYRFEEQMVMRLNLMGFAQDLKMHTKANLNGDYTFSDFDFKLSSGPFDFAAEGSVKQGMVLDISAKIGNAPQTYQIK